MMRIVSSLAYTAPPSAALLLLKRPPAQVMLAQEGLRILMAPPLCVIIKCGLRPKQQGQAKRSSCGGESKQASGLSQGGWQL